MLKFLDASETIISREYESGHVVVIEAGDPRFAEWAATAAPYEPDMLAAAMEARAERNRRLTACDWTQVADAPVDHAAWAAYRQALRDVPEQAGFPTEIVWPVAP